MGAEITAIWILIGSFLLMIVLRFPIAYAVAISSFFTLFVLGSSSCNNRPADGQRYQFF